MASKHDRSRYGGPMARLLSNQERRYPSLEAEKYHDLACGIIEQAVYDWICLEYGQLGYCIARNGHSLVYRAEVQSFFQSVWFEFLLSYALPNFEPTAFRKEMRIEERRPTVCESC